MQLFTTAIHQSQLQTLLHTLRTYTPVAEAPLSNILVCIRTYAWHVCTIPAA
jgi:hypothetical protein